VDLLHDGAGGHVPNAHRLAVAAARQQAASGAESDGRHTRFTLESARQRPSVSFPQPHRGVVAGGGEQVFVGRVKGQRQNRA